MILGWCPVRAFRRRRCGGPTDKALVALGVALALLAFYGVLKHLGVWS